MPRLIDPRGRGRRKPPPKPAPEPKPKPKEGAPQAAPEKESE